jgi:hypothetical protein
MRLENLVLENSLTAYPFVSGGDLELKYTAGECRIQLLNSQEPHFLISKARGIFTVDRG